MEMATERSGAMPRSARVQQTFIVAANVLFAAIIVLATVALSESGAALKGGFSEGAAFVVGLLHVSFGITAAAVRASARFQDAEDAGEVRREGRALSLGAGALMAAGSALILLSLAGPGRLVPPAGALAGALVLSALAWILVSVRWRGLDEMNRAATRDSGYLAFTWFSLVGGTWAMLAHLGFAAAPAPLDWLTMLNGFGFVAGLIVAARRGAFDTPR